LVEDEDENLEEVQEKPDEGELLIIRRVLIYLKGVEEEQGENNHPKDERMITIVLLTSSQQPKTKHKRTLNI